MSLPFNSSSHNLLAHLGLHNDQCLQHNAPNDFGVNHFMNDEGGFLRTQGHQQPASTNFVNPITCAGGVASQLGANQRVTQMTRTYVTPERVRVHTVTDYFHVQNHKPSPPSHPDGINHEFMRTHLLTATSTRERILQVINGHGRANWVNIQPFFQNHSSSTLPSMSMSHQPFTDRRAIHDSDDHPYYYNPIDHTPSYSNLYHHPSHYHGYFHNITSHYQNPPPRNRATLRLIEEDDESTEGPKSDGQPVSAVQQPPVVVVPPKNEVQDLDEPYTNPIHHQHQDQDSSSSSGDEGDRDHKIEDDGRTHSLPCKKYGPYTCPRCLRVFDTSQFFAAHMGSHYRTESRAERRRRQAAKYRKKHLRLVHSSDGLTVLPQHFKVPSTAGHRVNSNSTSTTSGRPSASRSAAKVAVGLGGVKAEKDYEIGHEPPAPPGFAVEVNVKKEPMEMT
ncbi:hypothetical protein FNV43_RR03044 [Rhamnella rubrinervis]|uniref:C2H2-type domain-containing protein n=1 Tax=Rhamnella rubrinervis TaxID=2594499 RepID=A0A8K0HH09_9ROSA|nr:hypothetical protein FNV43_RR03044 [Rhamnella rubrinervis]